MYPYHLLNFKLICGSTLSNIRPRLQNASKELIFSARCFAGDDKILLSRYYSRPYIQNMGGWSTPRPCRFNPGRDPVPTIWEAGWAPGPI